MTPTSRPKSKKNLNKDQAQPLPFHKPYASKRKIIPIITAYAAYVAKNLELKIGSKLIWCPNHTAAIPTAKETQAPIMCKIASTVTPRGLSLSFFSAIHAIFVPPNGTVSHLIPILISSLLCQSLDI